MSAKLIDGKQIAAEVEAEVRRECEALASKGVIPGLVAIRVGDDAASEVYVRNKAKKATELGLNGTQKHLSATTSQREIEAEIDRLNADDAVDGILLQLPLPSHLDSKALLDRIDPRKDVDGFHPVNVGRLQQGRPCLVPCTPMGVIRLLESSGIAIGGCRAIVVGRSDIVGKPVAALLLHRHATVTIAHSRTPDLAGAVREADIVVAAVGKAMMITGEMIKPGAAVIDVGINRIEYGFDKLDRLGEAKRNAVLTKGSALVGDVDFESARSVAGWITPVPGGVGPMTIAYLLKNTLQAAKDRRA
ncbi:MAG: bifunctional methylenetetrahydrofolate dehydrogenase/methenyltetrahydrofolate cyclohydrolase FolD [Acidobacteria bacterium]|nr:bifunctional methylenetetrahydrofolate dehydrogenase/methenyltetrahydrofolate cyclohydrolase FolD [Acidobacteriota bacterium]